MTINRIDAPSGQWLTQADPDIPIGRRIFVSSVSGYGDLEALYRLATEEEYEQHQQCMPRIRADRTVPPFLAASTESEGNPDAESESDAALAAT